MTDHGQPEQSHQQGQEQKNRPDDTIWSGRVKATMWGRDGEHGRLFDTTITATYTDKDGNPRDTPYLSSNDLAHAARVADKALDRQQELRREQAFSREERKAQHRDTRTQEPAQTRTPPRDR